MAAGTEVFFFGQFDGFILLSITRSQSQQSAHKDLEPKWPKTSHLGSRPLMLRLLSAPARAYTKTDRWVGGLLVV
ncbi:hypothetical protein FOS38_08410 [Lactobacillus rhamnosus]|nr:hypothetical protein [Lacticaseibacillus rhamnosus]TLQ25016.1 hypothetical protein FEZ43_07755 [Lacticaseibacillus rhamnosus]